jgi:hypothetical protein
VPPNSKVKNMHGDENSRDDWQDCSSGELTRMVGRLDARERRARFRQLASSGLLSMLLIAAGAILIGGFVIFEEPTFGGITCTDCLGHAVEYHDHLVGNSPMADVELVTMIETHLKECASCRTKFQQAYSDVPLEQLTKTVLRLGPLLPTFAVALSPTGY